MPATHLPDTDGTRRGRRQRASLPGPCGAPTSGNLTLLSLFLSLDFLCVAKVHPKKGSVMTTDRRAELEKAFVDADLDHSNSIDLYEFVQLYESQVGELPKPKTWDQANAAAAAAASARLPGGDSIGVGVSFVADVSKTTSFLEYTSALIKKSTSVREPALITPSVAAEANAKARAAVKAVIL
jgi:hypothetical protein